MWRILLFILVSSISLASVSKASESVSCEEGNGGASLKNTLVYPIESRKLREEGKTTLKVLVDETGHPAEIELYESSGFSRLDVAAIESVKSFCFIPARKAGEAWRAWVMVPISFKLDR